MEITTSIGDFFDAIALRLMAVRLDKGWWVGALLLLFSNPREGGRQLLAQHGILCTQTCIFIFKHHNPSIARS